MSITQLTPSTKERKKRRSKLKTIRPTNDAPRYYAPEEAWDIQFPTDLPEEDGEPLESNWHRAEISLLIETTQQHRKGQTDYYAGGNMFIYYSTEQLRTRDYRGPDFFVVLDVDGTFDRKSWVVWEENGRYPNVIIELLSPRTRRADQTTKKQLYAETFRTPEYFYYDPEELLLRGFRLAGAAYIDLEPNERGWLWSDELQLWLGLWEGEFQGHRHTWLRFYTPAGELVPTKEEAERQRAEAEQQRAEAERQRAEAEQQRAEAERQRADKAEAELAQLHQQLLALGLNPASLPPPDHEQGEDNLDV
jgi:Uma2 family endonuclease